MSENCGRAVRNIIFDLYGTLVDIHTNEWKDSVWQYMIRLLDMSGAHYEKPENLRDAYHNRVREAKHQASMAAGPGTTPEIDVGQVFRSLYTGKGVEPETWEVTAAARLFRVLSIERLKPFDGALELLEQLRGNGRGVYLLTNAQALFTRPELVSLGLDSKFDGILLSSEVGRKKPDPSFFRTLLQRYNLIPEESVMVGNDDSADCCGAAAVGMRSVYINTEQSPAQSGPLPVNSRQVKRLSDVLALLEIL